MGEKQRDCGNNAKRIGVHDPRNLVSVDPDEIPLLSGNP